MMKKYWYIAFVVCLTCVALPSCNDDDDEVEVDVEWYNLNVDKYNEIAKSGQYTAIPSMGNNGAVYYKVIKEGDGTYPIFYNSTLTAYYTGSMIDPDDHSQMLIFDQMEAPYQDPYANFDLSTMIEGWQVALAHMKKGDRWEIWLPSNLGYGSSGNYDGTIPGYTTLKFEVEIVEVIEPLIAP